MEIIPAIDIRGGKCVRLLQGREEAETVYDSDPVRMANRWRTEGARWIHIVNLDGAFGRSSQARDVVRSVAVLPGVRVQYGGGLRSREALRAASDAGAARLVIGTAAFEDRPLLEDALGEFGPARIVVALDARDGLVATHGWRESTGKDVVEAARELAAGGVKTILYTDIARDGMMTGPDVATLRRLGEAGPGVIASGGIASLEDLGALLDMAGAPLAGAIIGKALYEGKIALPAAIALAAARDVPRGGIGQQGGGG